MFAVDNVQQTLEAAQERNWQLYLKELQKLAVQQSRHKEFPSLSKKGYNTKYAGKENQLGRRTWVATVGPVPTGHEVLDFLPSGCSLATWDPPGINGEIRVWFAFPVLVHHQTLRKLIGRAGLEYVYCHGCTYKEVQEHVQRNGVNKVFKALRPSFF